MRVTYDPKVDALSIHFQNGTMTSKHPSEGVALDYDADGRLTGIEILDASHHFDDLDVLRQMTFEELGVKQPS